MVASCFFFQAEDGIRDLVRSRGLGDVYKRQPQAGEATVGPFGQQAARLVDKGAGVAYLQRRAVTRLLYTSDAADERSRVDLGGRRLIKKKKKT